VTRVVHRGCREGLEVGLRASKPDDGLHGQSIAVQTALCKISHRELAMHVSRHGTVLRLCSHLNHTRLSRRLQVIDRRLDHASATWVRFPSPAPIPPAPSQRQLALARRCSRCLNSRGSGCCPSASAGTSAGSPCVLRGDP
jgi:hypothetical protein